MHVPTRPPAPRVPGPEVALLVLLAAVVAACGGSAPIVTPAVADGLAARADQVAALAEAGDECEALEELAALRGDAATAAEDGSFPAAAHDELVSATDRISAALACEEDEEGDDDGDEDDDDDSEGSGKSRGRGKAKGKSKDDG